MRLFVFILLLGVFSECSSAANSWATIKQTTQIGDNAQSIGSYTAGCLSGAVSLPPNGTGYQLMRPTRGRSYGHPDLIRFIESIAKTASLQHWGVLLIGDLGQPRGGPTPSGHRSHQTGLDVDIWYLLSQQAAIRNLEFNERETWSSPSVLAANSDIIDDSQWSPAHEKILETAARRPEVDRIFVNPSVKRLLCTRKSAHDWLRKVRPWWGHDDHFHVRLKCPTNNKNCTGQEPLPESDGCDASLAWWFSEEAKTQALAAKKPEPPVLPALCDVVLKK
ncbi:penicillin-insensitive murein endopeptidase [Methylobacter sp.]|uniref:penicillin-insensitive murein endopeptidase n=1 Tax=Methylobacter sp. TaxID=2051955 RepID=UPI0011FA503F|nr:penicillin-insensitive murein endopeptidase [Methylobacter sp.]TAK60952.1 MAG: penicillin-insensitive murein endopeptidase [Methylobacter sp.]